MEISTLYAIAPIDGRYHRATEKMGDYFSESALIKYRILAKGGGRRSGVFRHAAQNQPHRF